MGKYGKFFAALLGAVAVGLNSFGVVNTGEAEAIVNAGIGLLTAFGVLAVPNKGYDGRW
jgi:hypothetical protein